MKPLIKEHGFEIVLNHENDLIPIGDALNNPDFIAAGIRDIRQSENSNIYVRLHTKEGSLFLDYFEIDAFIVKFS